LRCPGSALQQERCPGSALLLLHRLQQRCPCCIACSSAAPAASPAAALPLLHRTALICLCSSWPTPKTHVSYQPPLCHQLAHSGVHQTSHSQWDVSRWCVRWCPADDIAPKERWTALQKFARRAKEVAARCEYQTKANADRMLKRLTKKGSAGDDEGGGEDGEEEEEEEEDGEEEEGGEDEAQDALEDDLDVAGNADQAPPGIDHVYGSVVDTGERR